MAEAVGFKTLALYGDYSYSKFNADHSPYMIWLLRKTSNEEN
jgi:hypothetical protein